MTRVPAWFQFAAIALATFRLSRLLMVDTILDPLRARLDAAETAGLAALDKHRTPTVWQRAAAWLNELLSCVWCTSAWVGFGMAAAWWLAVGVAAPAVWVPAVALSASALSGVLALVVARLESDDD